jgi:hypothetical protein
MPRQGSGRASDRQASPAHAEGDAETVAEQRAYASLEAALVVAEEDGAYAEAERQAEDRAEGREYAQVAAAIRREDEQRAYREAEESAHDVRPVTVRPRTVTLRSRSRAPRRARRVARRTLARAPDADPAPARSADSSNARGPA